MQCVCFIDSGFSSCMYDMHTCGRKVYESISSSWCLHVYIYVYMYMRYIHSYGCVYNADIYIEHKYTQQFGITHTHTLIHTYIYRAAGVQALTDQQGDSGLYPLIHTCIHRSLLDLQVYIVIYPLIHIYVHTCSTVGPVGKWWLRDLWATRNVTPRTWVRCMFVRIQMRMLGGEGTYSLYVCLYVCMYICVYVYAYTYDRMCMYVYLYVLLRICMVHVFIYLCIFMWLVRDLWATCNVNPRT
jgi:hypothetical protein